MRELSLFTGAGGGLLGSKILEWRCVGYVEYEKYCQKIIRQRIADGILDAAPIFGDIRKFISDGYADAYKGMVDIVTGGFPCQPFSVAGKKAGENDPRNMWPSTIECIRIIQPKYAFLENVPGILADKYMGRIFGDLAESGYSFRWTCLGADDVGANHRRKRLWILAYSGSDTTGSAYGGTVGGSFGELQGVSEWNEMGVDVADGNQDVADTPSRESREQTERKGREDSGGGSEEVADAQINTGRISDRNDKKNGNWWSVEPRVGRVVTKFPFRVDRLKALGNGQVPTQMAYAFSKLSEGIIK